MLQRRNRCIASWAKKAGECAPAGEAYVRINLRDGEDRSFCGDRDGSCRGDKDGSLRGGGEGSCRGNEEGSFRGDEYSNEPITNNRVLVMAVGVDDKGGGAVCSGDQGVAGTNDGGVWGAGVGADGGGLRMRVTEAEVLQVGALAMKPRRLWRRCGR
jgi:hypothetical protein